MSELFDYGIEHGLLGAVLVTPSLLGSLLNDEALRPEHFHRPDYGEMFAAMIDLHDAGDAIDSLTIGAKLTGGVGATHAAMAEAAPGGTARTYARRLRDLHSRRSLKLAAMLIAQGADDGDMERVEEGERMLSTPLDAERTSWSPEELRDRFFARLSEPVDERVPYPFDKLNVWTGGGMRRKQVILIGGWTSNGKSVLQSQILDSAARHGKTTHNYINEMSEEERVQRDVARLSGVDFSRLYAGKINGDESSKVLAALPDLRVGLTECAGWTAGEIARHIRWNRWDVAGVDIVHEIAHRDERDLAEIAQTLRAAAKQADCILVACVHLNDNRVTTPQRPVPVLRDIRGSGMLSRGADVVLLVHLDDTEDGIPTPNGTLFAAKVRNGKPSAMPIRFEAERMRFMPRMGLVEHAA